MFTIEQVKAAHARVKSGADFPKYVQELKALGVSHYDLFVEDGRLGYYGAGNFKISGMAAYPAKPVANAGNAPALAHAISIHQQGQTDYPTFCDQAAAAGVEKWTTHMLDMVVTYYDKAGNQLISEPIPEVY